MRGSRVSGVDKVRGSAPLDRVRFVWPVAFDPTAGSGVPAPIGSIAMAIDGGASTGGGWVKVGAGAVQWVPWTNLLVLSGILSQLLALATQSTALATGAAATGRKTFPATTGIANGQTFVVGGVTFSAWVSGANPRVGTVVDLRTHGDAAWVEAQYSAAIAAEVGCTVAVASDDGGSINLVAKTAGSAGNVQITGTLPGAVAGMRNGADPVAVLYPNVADLGSVAAWWRTASVPLSVSASGALSALDLTIAIPPTSGAKFVATFVSTAVVDTAIFFRLGGATVTGVGFFGSQPGSQKWGVGVSVGQCAAVSAGAGHICQVRAYVGPITASGHRSLRLFYHDENSGTWQGPTLANLTANALGESSIGLGGPIGAGTTISCVLASLREDEI